MPELTEYAEPTADECGAKVFFGENLETYCTEEPKHPGPHMGFHPTQPNCGVLWRIDGEQHPTPAAIASEPIDISISLNGEHLAIQLEKFMDWLLKGGSYAPLDKPMPVKTVVKHYMTTLDD